MVHQGAWHKQQNNTRQLLAHSKHCGGGAMTGGATEWERRRGELSEDEGDIFIGIDWMMNYGVFSGL